MRTAHIVLYFTSLRAVRRTIEDCHVVRSIFHNHHVVVGGCQVWQCALRLQWGVTGAMSAMPRRAASEAFGATLLATRTVSCGVLHAAPNLLSDPDRTDEEDVCWFI
ncbi:hypothetical protein Cni_G13547 [Canna indica]|uniref:Uncharacterized protein n=1 Tax=Canna indica TaxID=4628 RepID=A0AAQ3KAB0_9LILI|nr:hypothetical protein Cni_G13547 [Canna indica]